MSEKVHVTIVAHGKEATVNAFNDEPLFEVAGPVMGLTGEARTNYEYRSANGVLLESWRSVGQLIRFGTGTRFFVNPPAGIGG